MTKKESLNFEKALERLENIIDRIDDDSKSLEESIQLYEEGIELAKHCTQTLENAELRIQEVNQEHNDETS